MLVGANRLDPALPPPRSGDRPLRVLVVGGEGHALRIPFLAALARRGFDVAAAGTGGEAAFAASGIPYHTYAYSRFLDPLADWRAYRSLSAIITAVRPDVIQTFDTKPAVLVPLAARRHAGIRVARTINGLGWVFSSQSPLALALRPAFKLAHAASLPWTALTVFQNRNDQQQFARAQLIGRGGSRLIPGSGVEPDRFTAAPASGPSPSEIRRKLGLGDAPVVITVSRLSRVKGIASLLAAARIVHATRPDVRFLLAGARESEGRLAISQQEIDRHAPYVISLGKRRDIPALLRVADVFAFPTELSEGVPRVLLEAALSGVPIVTTAMPGCTDVVADGRSGLVVPPRQPPALAAAILALLGDPARAAAFASRAREHVLTEFNLDLTVDRYIDAWASLTEVETEGATDRCR